MKIAVIGLGYVGLPLAHAFCEKFDVIGFDISNSRIDELKNAIDRTLELSSAQLSEAIENGIVFTSNSEEIADCNFFIVTVPTPIDINNKPDLSPLISASKLVSRYINKGDIIVYESTVYPGATEEVCVPILEEGSKLIFNEDFFCGYSPERINPGDKEHTVKKILKITSGSNPQISKKIDDVYSQVIEAGTYLAPSIKVAEAAKVIENSQRDINIAFVNELAIIFNKLNIDTSEVLKAAETKWNFLPFKPGLVGGHCIGVDPYYLTYKSLQAGYSPEVILAGRRLNDNMPIYIANQYVKLIASKVLQVKGFKVLILGITFKENCPDIRNSKVIDIYRELEEFGCNVDISDYWADSEEVLDEYHIHLKDNPLIDEYDGVVVAVAHDNYRSLKFRNDQIIYDVKSIIKEPYLRL